jgi:hypothetical protein
MGCGYSLQTSQSDLAEREHVSSVYVSPVINNTLRVGVENVVYNALVRNLSAHKTLRLVSRQEDADTTLQASIQSLSVGVNAVTPGENIKGVERVSKYYEKVPFTSYYTANLNCAFSLKKNHERPRGRGEKNRAANAAGTAPGEGRILWSTSFGRSKTYPAFLRTGPEGTTSALITDSELDRVLADMAASMMEDVHESMLTAF